MRQNKVHGDGYSSSVSLQADKILIYKEMLEGGGLNKLPTAYYASPEERRTHPLVVYYIALQLV